MHELRHLLQVLAELRQPRRVLDVLHAGHAADDDRLRMGVLATKDGHHLGGGALDAERVQIVRDRHEVLLGGQPVAGIAPVRVAEDPQAPRLDEVRSFCCTAAYVPSQAL